MIRNSRAGRLVFCLVICLLIRPFNINATLHKVFLQAKAEFFQLKSENKAIETLSFLIKEYEQYASPFFLQEYVYEFDVVLNGLHSQDSSKEYEQMLLLLLADVYRLNVNALQYKFVHAIEYISHALDYWHAQQDNLLIYSVAKNPIKWFQEKSSATEIAEHIQMLEDTLHKYTVTLGQLVNHAVTLSASVNELSYELMMTMYHQLNSICADVFQDEITMPERAYQPSRHFFKAMYELSMIQKGVKECLLDSINDHLKPNHIERHWLHYATVFGVCLFIARQKNNPDSIVHNIMEQYQITKSAEHFADVCKQNLIVPFQKLGNTLFGLPIEDLPKDHPTKFEPAAVFYQEATMVANSLAQDGYDQLPTDKNLHGTIKIPWIGVNDWYVPTGMTKEECELFMETNKFVGYCMYMGLRFAAMVAKLTLNMSHEIDLLLKMIACIPAVGLTYGGYKGIQRLCKFGPYANFKPLYTTLIDLQQCLLESTFDHEMVDGATKDYFQGKLFFLKYCARKFAVRLLSKSSYKTFVKDMQHITLTQDYTNDYAKMIEIMMKKYKIEQLACA